MSMFDDQLDASESHNEQLTESQAVAEFSKAFALFADIGEAETELRSVQSMRPTSLSEHAIRKGSILELEEKIAQLGANVEALSLIQIDKHSPGDDLRPLGTERWREQEIVKTIAKLGHAPTCMPAYKAGKKSIKSEVKNELNWSEAEFKKAWQRCLDFKDIAWSAK